MRDPSEMCGCGHVRGVHEVLRLRCPCSIMGCGCRDFVLHDLRWEGPRSREGPEPVRAVVEDRRPIIIRSLRPVTDEEAMRLVDQMSSQSSYPFVVLDGTVWEVL